MCVRIAKLTMTYHAMTTMTSKVAEIFLGFTENLGYTNNATLLWPHHMLETDFHDMLT